MPRPKKQHLKRRKDGRYCCRYKNMQFMGNTEEEALAAREAYKKRELMRLAMPMTVGSYVQEWLPLHKGNVSAKCYNDYAKQFEKLISVCGTQALDAVSVDDAARVWQAFAGMSASTIHRAKMLYVALFDSAIENDYCRKNPFRSRFAKPPKAPSGSHRALTEEEITLILQTPHRLQVPCLIMLYAGLRRGEVLALTSDDIDLAAGLIRIDKAIRFEGNAQVEAAPKTAAGVRNVPILSPLRPYLEGLTGRVAVSAKGKPMTETAFRAAWKGYMNTLSRAAGHTVSIRSHDLRHTYCTMLRDAGVDIKQAMAWLGHADEKMILHVYDHLGDKRFTTAVNAVESMFSNMQNNMQNQRD